jgi:hypothetical protein
VLIVSSNAVTKPPPLNVPRIEGERVKPTNSKLRVTPMESARDVNCLLGIELVVAARLADKNDDESSL